MLINKLQLPKINCDEFFGSIKWQNKNGGYVSYHITKQLELVLRQMFPSSLLKGTQFIVQCIDAQLNDVIHKDGKRSYSINYLLDKGGPNACVHLYDENKKFIKEYTQELEQWCILNTQNFHAVKNVSGVRKAICINFYDINKQQLEWINEHVQD